jgi:hypothetical protein
VKVTGKQCPQCSKPTIFVKRSGGRPFTMCIDPKCPSKADWGKKKEAAAPGVAEVAVKPGAAVKIKPETAGKAEAAKAEATVKQAAKAEAAVKPKTAVKKRKTKKTAEKETAEKAESEKAG